MNLKKKKIPALILCLSIVTAVMSALAAGASADAVRPRSTEVLSGLGVLTEELKADNNITRAELAEAAVRTTGYFDVPQTLTSRFGDVSADNERSGYINTAFDLGLMNAYTGNLFYPEENATVNDAVKAVVTILGYKNAAENGGGYPSGYAAIASSLGITENISSGGNDALTLGVLSQLIYDSLEVEILEYTDRSNMQTDGATILSAYLKAYKREGFVEANSIKTLTSEKAFNADEVIIDSVVYKTGASNAASFVGSYVEFYYRSDGGSERTIVYMDRKYENSVLMIDCDSIDYGKTNLDAGRISYMSGSGKTKYADISTTVALVNGMQEVLNDAALDFDGFSGGFIKLYNKDDDNEYDIAEIVKYKNYIVTDVNRSDNVIFMSDASSGENVSVKLDDDEINNTKYNEIILADKYDSEKTIDDVSADTVISLCAAADMTGTVLYTENKSVTGTVSRVENIGTIRRIDVGDYIFTLRGRLHNDISLNSDYTFYLDFMDNIAAVSMIGGTSNLGYLISVYSDGEGGDAAVRIYSAYNDAVEDYRLKNKLSIISPAGSKSYSSSDTQGIINALSQTADTNSGSAGVAQTIRYAVNLEGNITSITIPSQVQSSSGFSLGAVVDEAYINSVNYINGRWRITGDTQFILVPSDMTQKSEFEGADGVMQLTFYKNAKLYDVDESTNCVGTVVLYKDEVRYNVDAMESGTLGIVKSINEVWDEENGETAAQVTFLYRGAEQKVTFADGEYINDANLANIGDPKELAPGDAFKLMFSNSGKLMFGIRAYTVNNPEGSRFNMAARTGGRSGDNYYNYGIVKHSDGEWMIVSCDTNGDEIVNKLSGANIYVYDPEAPEKVRTGSNADVYAGAEILFKKNTSSYADIIVYKGVE